MSFEMWDTYYHTSNRAARKKKEEDAAASKTRPALGGKPMEIDGASLVATEITNATEADKSCSATVDSDTPTKCLQAHPVRLCPNRRKREALDVGGQPITISDQMQTQFDQDDKRQYSARIAKHEPFSSRM